MAAAHEDFEERLLRETPRGIPGQPGTMVDARWLTREELRDKWWGYRNDDREMAGVLFGYRQIDGKDKGIGTADSRHILTVASSRSGKGVLIISNLLLYEGSVIAVDPKGELARITARARREMGQKVVVLDPFGENGRYPSGCFNPLAELDPDSLDVKDDAMAIADALVVPNQRDPHWTDNARFLINALILFALTLRPEERNLNTVWQLASLEHPRVQTLALNNGVDGGEALSELLKSCDGVRYASAVVAAGERLKGMGERERGSVMSTMQTQLQFLSSDRMAETLKRSDFRLADLKTGKVTVYLSLPATKMGTHNGWLRVIVNLALVAFEREKTVPKIPILMVLDEFNVLGRMETIAKAAGLFGGFGVKLWVILQNLGQLRGHYPDSWETFIANAGIAAFWANTDPMTVKYLSEKLGQTTVRVVEATQATPGARLQGAPGSREEKRVQRLLGSDEVEWFLDKDTRRGLVFGSGKRPVVLKRPIYYEDEPFAGKYDP